MNQLLAGSKGDVVIKVFGSDLDFGKTIAFEFGIRHAFSDDMVLDVAAYNKDIVADPAARLVSLFDPSADRLTDFRILTNLDFGNVRGLKDEQMNDMEQLKTRLEARFPDALLAMDRPESETGTWWLDATVQRVVRHRLPMCAMRRLRHLPVGHGEATVPPAPVTPAILQVLIGWQVVPCLVQAFQIGCGRVQPGLDAVSADERKPVGL